MCSWGSLSSPPGGMYTQVSFGLKVGFFSKFKTRHSNCPQTLTLAFVDDYSVLQLKKTAVGLIGSQEMQISFFRKWA